MILTTPILSSSCPSTIENNRKEGRKHTRHSDIRQNDTQPNIMLSAICVVNAVIQPVCVAIKRIILSTIMLSVVMLGAAIEPMSFILSVSIKRIMLLIVMLSVANKTDNLNVILTAYSYAECRKINQLM